MIVARLVGSARSAKPRVWPRSRRYIRASRIIRQVDATLADADAEWAEDDAAAAIAYAEWVVDNARYAVLNAIDARATADSLAKSRK